MRKNFFAPLVALMFFCALGQAQTPGVTADKILIGQSTALSGQGSAKVAATVSGYQLYFDHINASGGVHGRKIQVLSLDDKYDPENTLLNTTRLVKKENVFAMFKYYGSPTMKAVLPLVEKEEVPVIAPSTGAAFVRQPSNKNVFNFKPGNTDEAEAVAEFIEKRLKIQEVGLFYQDDAFGNDGKTAFQKAMKGSNLSLVSSGSYNRKSGKIDQAIADLMKGKPKVVVLWSTDEATETFLRKAKELNFQPMFFGTATLIAPTFAKTLSEIGVKDFYVTAVAPMPNPESELGRQFAALTKKAGVQPNESVFEGFFDAAVFVEALKLAGRDLTRQSLREAFEQKMSNISINGMRPRFSPTNNQGFSEVRILKLNGSNYEPVGK